MRFSRIIFAAIAAIAVSACGQPQQSAQQDSGDSPSEQAEAPKPQPVFSIYGNTGRGGYQIYRNDERIASVVMDSTRSILGMRAYKGDCYTLMSRWQSDSTCMPAEIFKNGHPAMEFLPEFNARAFDMSGGHFYVMGQMDPENVVVYRDGSRILSMHIDAGKTPVAVAVAGQEVYVALQCSDSRVEVTKGGKHQRYIPGHCEDFRVSLAGCYMLSSGILYADTVVMQHQQHQYGGKAMYADPLSISVSSQNLYVRAKSTIHGQKYYGCVFRDGEWCMTMKPDSKPIGESPMQTVCAGIAACDAGVYVATYNTDSLGVPEQPMAFQYVFRNQQTSSSQSCFSLNFDSQDSRLLFLETSVN